MAPYFLKRLHVYFKTNNRAGVAISFSASILFSLVLLFARIIRTEQITYLFLVWNLFLAVIPLGISTLLTVYRLRKRNHIVSYSLTFIWLLFLPNSFYIITDLFHLYPRHGVPQWFDLVLILSFAWNGIMLGCASLFDMHEIIKQRFSWLSGWIFAGVALFLSSFGIYLGRFDRWNSWDIFQQPFRLMMDVYHYVTSPQDFPHVWGVTITYALLMSILYATVYQLTKVQSRELSAEKVARYK
ncbi:MAG: DUF1361 domain-containing protein [Bacteroidia bacterium]